MELEGAKDDKPIASEGGDGAAAAEKSAADAAKASADQAAEKAKKDAQESLEQAAGAKDVGKIRQALRDAQAAGVDAAAIKQGEKVLAELEAEIAKNDSAQAAKNAAITAMDEALKTQDVDKIKKAIDAAREKGVDAGEIASVETALQDVEAKLAHEVMLKGKVKDMQDALPSRDVEKIKSMMKAAEDAGVDPKDIKPIQEALDVIEKELRCKALVATMDEALQSADVEKVKDAISNARDGGVDASEIARGEKGLQKLEEELLRKKA